MLCANLQRFKEGIKMTIQNITMPQLGESVTEGTIEKWLVQPGESVEKYDPLAEVTTDKVNAEIPSSFTGVIKELIAQEGRTLPIGAVVCSIEVEEEDLPPQLPKRQSKVSEAIHNDGVQKPLLPLTDKAVNTTIASDEIQLTDQSQKTRYSPAVLKLAQNYSIPLEAVVGTGNGGRITRKDLHKLIEQGEIPKISSKLQEQQDSFVTFEKKDVEEPKHSQAQSPVQLVTGDIEIPVSSIRKAIANNMVRSSQEVPHAWMMMEVDVTDLVAYRDAIKDEFKAREGYNLTYFAFFIKAVAQALKEFPMMNSMWANDKIIQKKDINISIAVATEDAVFVPVIKQVDEKSIKGIARELHELTQIVRSGKLHMEDTQGGTFTVNNTGSFGSVQSKGIINYPQAAILQVETIVKKPVIMNGSMFAARDIVNLCLSLDHRILDGLICGKFLGRVKEILEKVNNVSTSVY